MRPGNQLKRFYFLLGACCLAAGLYYLVMTRPLIRAEQELDERVEESVARLASAGHGMTTEEVVEKIELLRKDIDAFTAIGSDPSRTIRFSGEVEEMLGRPFQLIEFDHRKFLITDRIRRLSEEREVEIFEDWERKLPAARDLEPYQLWAQLTAMDQLIRTAINGGIASIDQLDLVPTGGSGASDDVRELKVSVRMQLTGPMKAIHSILMMMPLNGEEIEALELDGATSPKSSFFLSRFILKKASAENPDEVTLDFVASGFLDAAPFF